MTHLSARLKRQTNMTAALKNQIHLLNVVISQGNIETYTGMSLIELEIEKVCITSLEIYVILYFV